MKCSGLTEPGSQKLALIGVTPFSTWGRMTFVTAPSQAATTVMGTFGGYYPI